MKKILKYFKPYMFLILVVIIFQAFRAYASLEIPGYTEKIVDIGVSKYGIEGVVPKFISEPMYDELNYFIEETSFLEHYSYIDIKKDFEIIKKYKKEYKINPEFNFYVLDDEIQNKELKQLEEELQYTVALLGAVSEMESMSPEEREQFDSQFKNVGEIPNEVLKAMQSKGNAYILKNAGVDLDSYQRAYILEQGGKMLALSLFMVIGILIAFYLSSMISVSVTSSLRHDLFEKVLKFSNADVNKFSTSTLITRITNDLQQVNNFISIVLQVAFFAPILAVAGFMKSYNNSSSMFFVTFSSVAFLITIMLIVTKLVVPRFKKGQILIDKLNLVSREIINGVLVIRAFTNEKLTNDKFEKANKEYIDNYLSIAYKMSTLMPTVMMIFNISAIAILWFGAKEITAGNMQAGSIMANIQYTGNVIFSFMMLTMVIFILPRAQVSITRIFEVLEHDLAIKSEGDEKLENIKGVVEFKNVGFKFDEKSEESALNNVSFVAKPNEITAIIGSTGSGKTTLLNLLPRLYDATSGEILIDGINVKNIEKESLHSQIAFVPQKTTLFSGTIKSNIKFASENINDEDMMKSAEIAEAIEFIESKEEKYDSEISQGGTNVSGGQKQRLSIARAVASNRKIFLFDDSFSALDYKTDAKLRDNLKSNLKDLTTIIVAQRISTIRYANQIIVLDKGEVVGIGNHNDLLENCEVYKEMALTQLPEEGLYNE